MLQISYWDGCRNELSLCIQDPPDQSETGNGRISMMHVIKGNKRRNEVPYFHVDVTQAEVVKKNPSCKWVILSC